MKPGVYYIDYRYECESNDSSLNSPQTHHLRSGKNHSRIITELEIRASILNGGREVENSVRIVGTSSVDDMMSLLCSREDRSIAEAAQHDSRKILRRSRRHKNPGRIQPAKLQVRSSIQTPRHRYLHLHFSEVWHKLDKTNRSAAHRPRESNRGDSRLRSE